jgi:membrane protease subunit (stomatin/prohibitin family)
MPRGFGGGFGRGGFGMRRGGMPLIGMGMGMGMGSPLLNGLMTGGLGYLLGRNSNQQQNQQDQQGTPAPTAQPSQAAPASTASADSEKLSQLKLLGELHDSGVLTDEEFTREKNRILSR